MVSIAAIEDCHAESLDDFKRRHRPCSELVVAMDKNPDDCFEYLYVPSSLGPLVRVTCCCGASWNEWDGSVSESPPPEKEGDVPSQVKEGVRLTLLALKRPGLLFGNAGEMSPYQVEAFWHGWINAASIGDSAAAELLEHLDRSMRSRASQRLGIEPTLLGQCLADSYLANGYSADEVLEMWRVGITACIREEFPAIASHVL